VITTLTNGTAKRTETRIEFFIKCAAEREEGVRCVTTNSMCIFFLSHKDCSLRFDLLEILSLSYEKEKRPQQVSQWFVAGGTRGIIPVNDENRDAYEQVIKGHLKYIRSKDVLGYYDFLLGLTTSSIKWIREDTEMVDLRYLIQLSTSETDLAKMLENPRLTSETKNFVQRILEYRQEQRRKKEEGEQKKTE
jgi:hypothetical protein